MLFPKVSIITATYNRAMLLTSRAMPSVLAQTFKDFEYLIIDDGSTDDTELLLKEVQDKRLKYIRNNDRTPYYPQTALHHWLVGPVRAKNIGLEYAKGKYIAFIDDDDIWTPNHLKESLEFLIKHGYDFVSSENQEIRDGKTQIAKCYHAESKYYGWPKNNNKSPKIGSVNTWVYKRNKLRYNPECWKAKINRVNDIEISQRMYKAGIKMGFINNVHCYTIPRPEAKGLVGAKAYTENASLYEEFYK